MAFLIRIYPLAEMKGQEEAEKNSLCFVFCVHAAHIHTCYARIKWHTLCVSKFQFLWHFARSPSLAHSLSLPSFFPVILSLPDAVFPLSALLKWMNCRFEKYCCCHLALCRTHPHTHSQSWSSFQPDSTQSNPKEGKSHCFLAQRRDFEREKNRRAERNKPKQRLAFISVFGLFFSSFHSSAIPSSTPWFCAQQRTLCVYMCVVGNRTSTFYTSTMIFIYMKLEECTKKRLTFYWKVVPAFSIRRFHM